VTRGRGRAAALCVAAALVAPVLAGGCGSSAAMSQSARSRLQADTSKIRQAVNAGHEGQAVLAVRTLRSDVATLEAEGVVSSSAGAAVLAAAAQVGDNLYLLGRPSLGATTSTTTSIPVTTPTTGPPATRPPKPPKPPKHHPGHGPGGGDGGPGNPGN